jgi:hypothetical protein
MTKQDSPQTIFGIPIVVTKDVPKTQFMLVTPGIKEEIFNKTTGVTYERTIKEPKAVIITNLAHPNALIWLSQRLQRAVRHLWGGKNAKELNKTRSRQ